MNEAIPQTIFVIDDDEAFRESLVWLLQSRGYRVSAYASAEAFLAEVTDHSAGCLVTDVRMTGLSGLELQDALLARGLTLPTILISGHGDLPMAMAAFRKGAADFVEKPLKDLYLLTRIDACLAQDQERRQRQRTQESLAQRLASLTGREREVLDRIVNGLLNKQIADDLGISIKTVEIHRSRAMSKMAVATLADLIKCSLIWTAAERPPPAGEQEGADTAGLRRSPSHNK